jgi:hypothetical protein
MAYIFFRSIATSKTFTHHESARRVLFQIEGDDQHVNPNEVTNITN